MMRHIRLLCLAVGFAALPAAVAVGQADRVRIQTVEVHSSDRGPVVLLKAEEKAIPIFVDYTVAGSIHAALSGRQTARPLSHDLMRAILESLDAKVTQTVITLKDQTFYGALSIATKDGTKVFDSRSSDSIALAVHFHAPIWVSRELLEKSGQSSTGPGLPKEQL